MYLFEKIRVSSFSLIILICLFQLSNAQNTPLFADVPVSDTSGFNGIGSANTSRNVVVSNSGIIYVVYASNGEIRLTRSLNRGQSFEPSVLVGNANTEPELAVGDNGNVYVAWTSFGNTSLSISTDNGQTFSVPRNIGSLGGSSRLHMSTYESSVYLVGQSGSDLLYNNNNGQGAFQNRQVANGRSFVYADVLVDLSGRVLMPTDNPTLFLFSSIDRGNTINEVNLNPGGQVFFSSYSLTDGPCGTLLFTGGSDTEGYVINTETGVTTPIQLGNNNGNSEGRTLYADNTGTLIDGYNFNGDLLISVSSDQGQNFSPPITVASGSSHNIARNPTNGDIIVVYSSNGDIFVTVYDGLLKAISLESPSASIISCTNQTVTLDFTLTNGFSPGTVIDALLSDENGSFVNATNIGQITTNTSGQISVTIPGGLANSSDYVIILESIANCVRSNAISVEVNSGTSLTGNDSSCIGTTTQLMGSDSPSLTDPWVSSDPAVASVSSSGLVTAISSGTTEITYTNDEDCSATLVFTVFADPIINSDSTICLSDEITLSSNNNPNISNPWESTDINIATIDQNGQLTPILPGSVTILYTDENGCTGSTTISITSPPEISGDQGLCVGGSRFLTASTSPNTVNPWTSNDPGIATVDDAGEVMAIATGNVVITYTDIDGCNADFEITVNDGPDIEGQPMICNGGTSQFTSSNPLRPIDPWTSDDPNIFTVDELGNVTALSTGTAMLTAHDVDGCSNQIEVTVLALPEIIAPELICLNEEIEFMATTIPAQDDAWLSSNTDVASVNQQGILIPNQPGTTIISFLDSNGCSTEKAFEILAPPLTSLEETYFICISADGSEILTTTSIETGLNTSDYSFEWFFDNELIAGENSPNLEADQQGIYTVEITDLNTLCVNNFNTDVIAHSPPILSGEYLSPLFAEDQRILLIAEGLSEYEYNVNNQPFQAEPIFSNLPTGNNTFTARDINGCGQDSITLFIISYPKFFTPNQDGFNDEWIIDGLTNENAPIISIFDRFGKLIYLTNNHVSGWDGTFNGQPLPSSDYWFTIELTNLQTQRREQFSSHFSLKR